MNYFAGLFDAEGYISLCPNGAFTIAVEMSNEKIPNLFKEQFQGSIYIRKRDKRKKTWIWKINSISDQSLNFINSIEPYSIVKKPQLNRLRDYLQVSRNERKSIRSITCSSLKQLKQPILELHNILPRMEKPIETNFFEWFAGFLDGDGNFVCNEYIDNRNNEKYFSRQISVANTFLEAICHINDRIPGCISLLNRIKNPLYKWTCKRNSEKFVCESIYPFLKIKKSQCDFFMKFISLPEKKRGIPYPIEFRDQMYDIITQIKHLNSL